MHEFALLLRQSEDWLAGRALAYATERGYTAHASISEEACRLFIRGLSEALQEALGRGLAAVEMGPDDRFGESLLEAFAVAEARRQQAQGISLGEFLGLMSQYRQSYLDLVEQSMLADQLRRDSLRFASRFFDRLATAVSVDWNADDNSAEQAALRQQNQCTLSEKRHLAAVFQALPNAVILSDPEGRITDLNQTACRWLSETLGGEPGPDGGEVCPSSETFVSKDLAALLPWVAPALERLRSSLSADHAEPIGLERLAEGEKLAFLDTRVFPLFSASGAFEGIAVIIQDVTALRDASETQARIASELRGQLREAAGLNRLAEVLSRNQDGDAELLQGAADILPLCWDAPDGMTARISFDGQDYFSAAAPGATCSHSLAQPLNVLGHERGAVHLCSPHAAHPFQPDDEAMLSAIARQLEHVLDTRISLAMLSKSERQFREFFNNAADAIFIHDGQGRILDANKNAGIWLNLSTESLSGANLLENMAEADQKAGASHLANALTGAPELFQATLVRRDGFTIPAEFLCQAQEFQGQPALITSARNTASRQKNQAEIEHRLETEALVSAISGRLINSGDKEMALAIEECLADLCRFLDMRLGGVFLFHARTRTFTLTHQTRTLTDDALPRSLRRLGPRKAPWLTERILAGERVFIRDAAHMPPAGHKEKELLSGAGISCLAAVPMLVNDRLLGMLIIASAAPRDTARLTDSRVLGQVTLLLSTVIERLGAATALRRSESLSRAILDALPANLCVLDRHGVLTMVNRSWAATGPESTPLCSGVRLRLGDNYLEACRAAQDNTHAAAALAGIQAVLSGKAPFFRTEYPGTVTGKQRWFVMQATPLAKGMTGAVVSHRDITERMQAINELRESEERFRIIVETAQEAIIMLDTKAAVTYANPRAGTLFGYELQDLLGRPFFDILDPEDRSLVLQKIKRRRQGLSDQYELRFRHKNGQRIWTLVNASPLIGPDGLHAGSIGLITDISDRIRAEARMRRNEARYRSLVESMHEGLLMAKPGGVITYANDRLCEMLGRSKAVITGRPVTEFVEEGSQRRMAEMLISSHPGGQPDHHRTGAEEILWKHATGRHIYSLVSPSISADEEGKAAGFFAVITDTTERKGLESQLMHSQKLEAIGQLAAGIAHEINTPAQYVGNNTQFIKGAFDDIFVIIHAVRELINGAKTACPGMADIDALEKLMVERDINYLAEEVPGALNQTLEGVERISTIVRSVKQFAHPGAAIMAPSDLNESMKSTATVSRNEWKYVSELDLNLDPALPLVTCMSGEINQVVLNLIINAAHAIADAKKTDPSREGRITLSTRFAPPWAEIRVADTGTGIPAAVQTKIFDPFFTTKEVGRGTGQGLTISRSIVMEKHKGQLFFETEQGAGTTFVVRLPLEQKEV
ncbi:MAG: PAS domain S-box protein [Humidesulfovibrio sp.]|uniref:PAS domain S-box protein n=1 Tax=Humidesulfovibrio sp. TaxID=2910988 RepID=UPI002732C1A2|nr:PAS domain S-box protein [Humidesulfovibrio sp.]MDP2847499.1 PAS domain S-box protein [Humidesulfovibrio sp.]